MKKILSLLLVFSLATPVFAINPVGANVPSTSPVKESLDLSELKEHIKEEKANWATLKRWIINQRMFRVVATVGAIFAGYTLATSFARRVLVAVSTFGVYTLIYDVSFLSRRFL
jgi:hypothetical protein